VNAGEIFAPGLRTVALAAVSTALPDGASVCAHHGWTPDMLAPSVTALRAAPPLADAALVALADSFALTDAELLAATLAAAVEEDPGLCREIGAAQAPLGGARPLLGLMATALAPLGATALGLATGSAVASGMLRLGHEDAPLPERSIAFHLPTLAALNGRAAAWEDVRPIDAPDMPLPQQRISAAARWAHALAGGTPRGLVLRCAAQPEAVATAALVADRLGRALAHTADVKPGLAAWLVAARRVPVFTANLAPGERWKVPDPTPYAGPWFVATGLDGLIESDAAIGEWVLPVPGPHERERLWRAAGFTAADAARAAASWRQGAGRIAEIAARARVATAVGPARRYGWRDAAAALAGAGGAGALDGLAQRSTATVEADALVAPRPLGEALERLVERCRRRDGLADGLGPAITARYRPGVRALFHGGSGTGKSLAADWLAGRLGLPLYRVDLAALTSKWIGETEKNLSALLAAAEHADVVLFFDEADALFAARTEVSDANDRFANAQTNYLLQRIESFDGIAILASNSRDRFDAAFIRRLDAILEFPMPEAPARRLLWQAHLGRGHALSEVALDRLAVTVDLAGGHIRNVVLAAAAEAKAAARPIGWRELATATAEEYAKLGRPPPAGLDDEGARQ
jgi:hypothetical protein